jgi:hypothetical protein
VSRSRILAVAFLGVYLALIVIGSAFALRNGEAALKNANSFIAYFALPFALVGTLIVWHRRGNRFGWVMAAIALSFAAWFAARQYAVYALVTAPQALPGGVLALWSTGAWADLGWALGLTLLPLLFPDGAPPSPRWRPVVWLAALLVVFNVVQGQILNLPKDPPVPPGAYPFGLSRNDALRAALWLPVILLVYVPIATVCVVAPFARFRLAGPIQRQQLKYFIFAAGVFFVALLLDVLSQSAGSPNPQIFAAGDLLPRLVGALLVAAILGFPLAIGVAVLRYRLYDIDLLINRTLVYGATSAAIAATFWVGIIALQAVFRPLTSGSELAIAAATLVSFGLFQPVRRRVQDAIDQRFDRSRYDAARTLDAFADRLRDEVDLDALQEDLIRAVRQTMSPAHASVWLRERAL